MNLDCVSARFAVKEKSYCFTMTLMTVNKARSVGIILRNVVDVARMFRGLIKTKRLPLGTGEQTMNKCDFCQHSYNKDGRCICAFGWRGCRLTQSQIFELMKRIAEVRR